MQDIVTYAERILKHVQGATLDAFIADEDLHDAVYYRLQCISEATRNLLLIDPSIVERYPEIPWARVRNMGNVVRHEYGAIDSSTVWQIITGDRLRDLLAVARRELERLHA